LVELCAAAVKIDPDLSVPRGKLFEMAETFNRRQRTCLWVAAAAFLAIAIIVSNDGLAALAIGSLPNVLRTLYKTCLIIGMPLFHELWWLFAIGLFLSFVEICALLQLRATNKVRRECPENEYEFAEPPSDDATLVIISGLLLVIWPLTLLLISPPLFVLGLALAMPVVILASCELAARYEEAQTRGKKTRRRVHGLFVALFRRGRQNADSRSDRTSD